MQGQIIDILHLSVQDIFSIKFDDSKLKKKTAQPPLKELNGRSLRIIRDKLSYSLSQIDDIVHLELSKATTCQST